VHLLYNVRSSQVLVLWSFPQSNLFYSKSSGSVGYKGKQKNTSLALKVLLRRVQKTIKKNTVNNQVKVF
jgi:ribosomal protein S11